MVKIARYLRSDGPHPSKIRRRPRCLSPGPAPRIPVSHFPLSSPLLDGKRCEIPFPGSLPPGCHSPAIDFCFVGNGGGAQTDGRTRAGAGMRAFRAGSQAGQRNDGLHSLQSSSTLSGIALTI